MRAALDLDVHNLARAKELNTYINDSDDLSEAHDTASDSVI